MQSQHTTNITGLDLLSQILVNRTQESFADLATP